MNMAFQPELMAVKLIDRDDSAAIARIEQFVADHPQSTPFHRPAWMTAVTKGCGHDWIYLLAENGQGEIAAILPLHMVHSLLFGRAIVSSGFAVDGGILSLSEQATRLLADAAIDHAERHSFPSIELRGGPQPTGDWSVHDDVYAGFVTDLAEDDEAQLLAIPRKQRAEIRKGLKNGLEVQTGSHAADLTAHYEIYAESVRNLGTPVFPRCLFAEVIEQFGDDADILTVMSGDKPVASVLSLYHHGTVMPYWGGGCWDARRLRANDVMYYALMNHGRRRGCSRFDFGRSKFGTGAFAFKKNWGFEPVALPYLSWSKDQNGVRDINPMSPKYRLQVALWQRLPLPIANRLGPIIARGLG